VTQREPVVFRHKLSGHKTDPLRAGGKTSQQVDRAMERNLGAVLGILWVQICCELC